MKIKYTKQAVKTLKAYDQKTRNLIREKISGLTKTPPEGDIKPLKGSKTEKRLRVGKYRVIYEYLKETQEKIVVKILMVNKVDSRGNIYK
jgi:mRNA interferase RelE/StbE